jgi:hypothetical protein
LDWQSKLSNQFPLAGRRVVYSASGNSLAAAIVEDDRAVIEHKLYWAAFSTEAEAAFVCAVLNAPETTRRVAPLQSRGLFGARDFDMYVWYLNIPSYDPEDPLHTQLVACYGQAVAVTKAMTFAPGSGFQTTRGLIRTALGDAGITNALDAAVSAILDKNP